MHKRYSYYHGIAMASPEHRHHKNGSTERHHTITRTSPEYQPNTKSSMATSRTKLKRYGAEGSHWMSDLCLLILFILIPRNSKIETILRISRIQAATTIFSMFSLTQFLATVIFIVLSYALWMSPSRIRTCPGRKFCYSIAFSIRDLKIKCIYPD